GETGVAGSFALTYAKLENQAVAGLDRGPVTSSPTTMNLTGGNVSVRTENTTKSDVVATSKVEGASSTGVGASIGINILLSDTVSEIRDNESISGNTGAFAVRADSASTVTTATEAGAAGKTETSVGGAVSIVYVENETLARVGKPAVDTPVTLTGDLAVEAKHSNTVTTTASGEAAGTDVGVGISLALNILQDDTRAELARSFKGAQDVNVLATSIIAASADTKASAKGQESSYGADADSDGKGDNKSRTSDEETSRYTDLANSQSGGSNAPSTNTESSLSTADSSASGESSQSTGGSTSVAATIAVNYADVDNKALIADGVIIGATGDLAVDATVTLDLSAQGLATSTDIQSDTGVAAAVGLNIGLLDNSAIVGAGANLTAGDIEVQALTAPGQTNTFKARALAGAASSGDGIGGSISVNFLELDNHAKVNSGATLNATGGGIDVVATSKNEMQNIAGGAGISLEGDTGVGVAVAVNIITGTDGTGLNTTASLGDNVTATAGKGSVNVAANATLVPITETLPIVGEVGVTTFAAGLAISTGGTVVGGSASVDVYFVDTHASIGDDAKVSASQDIS